MPRDFREGDRVEGVLDRSLPLLYGDKQIAPTPFSGVVAYAIPGRSWVWVEFDSDGICRLVLIKDIQEVLLEQAIIR